MRMLRVSFVLSVGAHVLLLSVVSVVVAQYARRTMPETRTFQVTVQYTARPRVQAGARAADAVQKPTVAALPTLPHAPQPLPVTVPLTKRPPVLERPAPAPRPLIAPPRPKSASAAAPVSQMPLPRETSQLAAAFPTALPTPTPVRVQPARTAPTPRATVAPTPIDMVETTPPTVTRTVMRTPALASMPAVETAIAVTVDRPALPTPLSLAATGNTPPLPERATAAPAELSGERQPPAAQTEPPANDQQRVLKAYVRDLATRLQAAQTYPRKARRNGWEGTVTIRLHLRSSGELEKAELAQSSGVDVLDQAALRAAQDAQPLPEFPDGVSASTLIVNIPIRYQLQ